MYDFNTSSIEESESEATKGSGSGKTKTKSIHEWGGPTTRRALHAIYTLAFICLLRSDEVLKIHRQDIELVTKEDGTVYMVLTLPFRKTHQDGRAFPFFLMPFSISFITLMPDIQPFYLYPLNDDEEHLCPVRAMAKWIDASQVTSGFMFRKFTAQDRPSDLEDAPMVGE